MACVLVWHLVGSVAVAAQLTSEDHATPDQERPVGTEYSIETAVRESLVESDRHYRDGSPLEALATLETFSFPDTPPVGFRAEDAHQPLPAALRHEVLWRQSRAALAGGLLEENERRIHEVERSPARHRVLGRVFTSGDLLGSASWEGARFHLERAVQLDPEMIY